MIGIDNFGECSEKKENLVQPHRRKVTRWRHWRPVPARLGPLAILWLTLALPLSGMAKTCFDFTSFDAPVPGAFQTSPIGINDKGQIAGFYLIGDLLSHAFLLSHGHFEIFDLDSQGCTDFHGINNRGQIVGNSCNGAFLFDGGQFSIIEDSGNILSSAEGINNAGDIVGGDPAFLFHRGTFSYIPGADRALGINDKDEIVGTIGLHGYVLADGVITLIDFPAADNGTQPEAINNRSTIVGFYSIISGTGTLLRGFILDEQGFSTILFPGSLETQVFGINNRGQIVGSYFDGTGWHGFVATPTHCDR